MIVNFIYIANFLLVICYTAALWLISVKSKKLRGMRSLAWAYSAALTSIVLAAISYQRSWFLHVIAPEFLLACFILMNRAFLSFVNRPPKFRFGWIFLLGVGFVGFVYSGLRMDHYLFRAVLTAGLLGVQTLVSACMLLEYEPSELKAPSRALAIIFLLFSLRCILRTGVIAIFHIMPERLPGVGFQIGGVSSYLIINALTPLGYMWMETTRLQKDMETLSSTDFLTGVLNRRAFDEIGIVEMERARRHGQPLSVVAIDVDHFKMLNDQFGHTGGDRALVQVAETVRDILRSADVLARFGGDEFVLLLPATDFHGARELAERVRERVASLNIEMRGRRLPVQASFGIATMDMRKPDTTPMDNWDEILEHADAALYRAKEGGRNRVM
jgi:diguanylate cyclase (GGDEF)-like protein